MNFLVIIFVIFVSLAMDSDFFVFFVPVSTDELEIKVQICNAAACTTTEVIPITLCETNEEEREQSIALILNNVCVLFVNVHMLIFT